MAASTPPPPPLIPASATPPGPGRSAPPPPGTAAAVSVTVDVGGAVAASAGDPNAQRAGHAAAGPRVNVGATDGHDGSNRYAAPAPPHGCTYAPGAPRGSISSPSADAGGEYSAALASGGVSSHDADADALTATAFTVALSHGGCAAVGPTDTTAEPSNAGACDRSTNPPAPSGTGVKEAAARSVAVAFSVASASSLTEPSASTATQWSL